MRAETRAIFEGPETYSYPGEAHGEFASRCFYYVTPVSLPPQARQPTKFSQGLGKQGRDISVRALLAPSIRLD